MLEEIKKPIETTSITTADLMAEMVVDSHDNTAFLIYQRDNEQATVIRDTKLLIPGMPMPYIPIKSGDPKLRSVLWPTEATEYGTDAELFEEIRKFIHKWVDVKEEYEMIAIFYVFFTYVYQEFYEVPYLRILADLGSGKAQPLNAKILTPEGWQTMGEMKIGSEVITPNGGKAKVIAIHPQGKRDIYEITFNDGAKTRTTAEHLFYCWRTNPWKPYGRAVRSVLEIKDIIERTKGRVIIPLAEPLPMPARETPIDPYVLGVLLGDGSIREHNITMTSIDEEILERVRQRLPAGIALKKRQKITYSITADKRNEKGYPTNYFLDEIKKLGLAPAPSHRKFVPEIYKDNSIEVRLEMLRGLMDTDGTIDKGGHLSFTSKSKQLASDVAYLVRSLGGKATMTKVKKKCCNNGKWGIYWTVYIRAKIEKEFFALTRKRDRSRPYNGGMGEMGRRVVSVKKLKFHIEEAQCITIDNPDGLYITDDFIITHNSRFGVDVLGSIVYKGIRTIAVSSISSLFRVVHLLRGTLILDEADVGNNSDKNSELVQMLNSGYKNGLFIMRCERKGKSQTFEAENFNVFGPKIILSREHMKDHALESRCIPIRMAETTRTDLPLLVDKSLEEDAQVLRNKLLMWRFRNYSKKTKQIDPRFNGMSISSRTKQLLMLLSSVIDDERIKDMLFAYGERLHKENMMRRGESNDGLVLFAIRAMTMAKCYKVGEQIFLATSDVANMVNEHNLKADKDLSTKYVGHICRETFNFAPERTGVERGFIFSVEQFNACADRFAIDKIPPENDPVIHIATLDSVLDSL